jgi:hypothetical protein
VSTAYDPAVDLAPIVDSLPDRRFPATANLVSAILLVVGIAAFATGLFALDDQGVYAWGAFLVGLLWTFAVAQGGVIFSVIQAGTWGRWGRPVKRIAEAFGFYLPVAYLLLVVFLLLGLKIYPWNPATAVAGGPVDLMPHSPEAWASKPVWLTPGFFTARLLGAVGLMIVLDIVFVRASLRPDLVAAQQRLGARAPGWWSRITGGETDVRRALVNGLRTQSLLVPILGVTYALVMSLVAFDLVMSLSPWWYSNMFGGWTFVSSFWLSLAALGLTVSLARDWLGISRFIGANVTHDLGKLMLAGCMFWAYTGFAQLLPIWYTDMPEETDFLLVRMFLPEWSWLAQTVAICCFLAPFTILLSRGIKKMRWPFAGICVLIMVGIFLERSLLVLPSIHFGDPRTALHAFVSVGTWLGFVGLFVQVVGRVLASIPPIGITDPHLETHPWDVHVHAFELPASASRNTSRHASENPGEI